MQTVVETPTFQKSAVRSGMTEKEVIRLIDYLASNPDAGDEIKGTGGCRKVRVAGRGKGKSGGYRVITFFSGKTIPLFLFYAYSKADRDDLDAAQRNALRSVTKEIVEAYGRYKHVRSVK
ncbi:MAG TPA: type II toxin-antitoxin system RelE/ParE family toxin [Rhizomicrobium sp.]|nr:type II toxin-antitoxin system RelE/ParE family toxin [Rhizomicrobium sp.]